MSKKKTAILTEPVSPEVAAFCVVMENKLQREGYPDVTAWEHLPTPLLIRQLESKVGALRALEGKPAELFAKAAVIGLLSMMLAELVSRQHKRPFNLKDDKSDIIFSARMLCSNGSSPGERE